MINRTVLLYIKIPKDSVSIFNLVGCNSNVISSIGSIDDDTIFISDKYALSGANRLA